MTPFRRYSAVFLSAAWLGIWSLPSRCHCCSLCLTLTPLLLSFTWNLACALWSMADFFISVLCALHCPHLIQEVYISKANRASQNYSADTSWWWSLKHHVMLHEPFGQAWEEKIPTCPWWKQKLTSKRTTLHAIDSSVEQEWTTDAPLLTRSSSLSLNQSKHRTLQWQEWLASSLCLQDYSNGEPHEVTSSPEENNWFEESESWLVMNLENDLLDMSLWGKEVKSNLGSGFSIPSGIWSFKSTSCLVNQCSLTLNTLSL